jgi:hypothetical protein
MTIKLHRLTLAMAMTTPPPGGRALATTNPTITGAWSQIVAEGDEFLLSFPLASQTVYVAIGGADDSDSDSDPQPPPASLIGHALAPGRDSVNRALVGPGPVFCRIVDPAASVAVALTVWTPT